MRPICEKISLVFRDISWDANVTRGLKSEFPFKLIVSSAHYVLVEECHVMMSFA